MKINIKKSPRIFYPRGDEKIQIKDCGDIYLEDDEQVTFVKMSGSRFDFVSKNWGFYATPSVNKRLKSENFKTAIVKNNFGSIYIMSVEITKLDLFEKYCAMEEQKVIEWLDER